MRTIASVVSVSARSKRDLQRKSLSRVKPEKTRRDLLRLERLEDRFLMAADLLSGDDAYGVLSTEPVQEIALPDPLPLTAGPAQAPLSSLPQLHSNASATAKLFLDFDGHFEASWGSHTNVTTPAFDQDGDPTTFSAGELATIQQVWARVAEDYAPFNIDVTTVDPGNETNKVTAVVAIGGSYGDWYGSSAGGVAYVGGFSNVSSNVGYIFAQNLGGDPKYISEAASHESGHLFGLEHQATWSGTTLVSEYNSGNADWAPLMGVGYYATRTTWYNGPNSAMSTAYQDDMAVIGGALNGFGFRADDYGGTIGTASALPTIGTSVNFTGLIGQSNDLDMWSFTTTGGTVTFQLTGAQYGTNLDAILELRNSSGTTILSDAPSASLGASLSTTLSAGTYYLVARSVGDYGDVGQYTITGSLPAASTAPEIALSVGGVAVADGGTVNFGSTSLGTAVTKTFTVTNQGSAVLSLTSLNAGSLPTGYTLISNLGATSLNPGDTTTFVIRLDASAAGSPGGTIQLLNNDGDESPYDLVLSGTVTAPEINIDIAGTGVADGQTVSFGSTTQGQSVTRTFTVTNTGTATLSLTSLNAGSLPSGFTLLSNLGSTSLAAGQSTTFSIRLDATVAGSYSGSIQLLNNDADENSYDISLTGSVASPEIAVTLAGVNLTAGQSVNFGSTVVGSPINQTFTVSNTGTSTLHLTPLDPANFPAGFSLVSSFTTTAVAPGQATTFTVQFGASVAGTFGGTLVVVSDDSDESSFNLQLQATALAPTPAHLTAEVAGQALTAGGTLDFGTTLTGSPLDRTIWIHNDGQTVLTLTPLDPTSLPSGYSLLQDLTTTSLLAGESTSFIVRLNAQAAGNYAGSFSLTSNSGSFSFNLAAAVVDPVTPMLQILDDGSPGSSQSGTWQKTSGKGYEADSRSANKGSGQSVYAWSFSNLPAGEYQVWATWAKSSTNATNAPFSLYDGTTKLATAAVNQRLAPTGLTVSGANWKLLGTVTVSGGQLIVKLSNAANGKVIADAIRIERVNPVHAPAAEIDLFGASGSINAGTSTVDFGSPDLGSPQVRTFTIYNHGTGSLTLTPLDPANLPPGYSLVQNLGSTFLTPGESTTFTIRLDAAQAGLFTGTISVLSDAANQSCFCFQVTGMVYDPTAAVTRIIDDGSPANSRAGSWTHVTTAGYAGDQHTAAAGTGASTSTWAFGDLANGDYRVQASWKKAPTNAFNAPFSAFSGGQLVGKTTVNQRLAANDQWDGGWFETMMIVTVTNHQLTVKLTNAAKGTVVADAIRIEKILASGAALPSLPNSATPPATYDSLLGDVLASLRAALPDEVPLPVVRSGSDLSHYLGLRPDSPVSALSDTEPEEQLLSTALDLISEARQSLTSSSHDAAIQRAHDLALGSILGQLL